MRLLQIQEKLQSTIVAVRQLEASLIEHPDSPSLRANIKSLQKLQRNYEAEFLVAADERGEDVCSYRLFGLGNPTIAAMSKALGGFQSMFSVVYDAIKHGPKNRAKMSMDVAQATTFSFGYTFPGSVGIVFTLPNERLLPGFQTDLDKTFGRISDIARAERQDQIAALAKELGAPPIRATYRWAKDHAENGLGANIEWRRDKEVRQAITVQQPELARLKSTIESVSAESSEDLAVRGVLVAANTIRRTFHIVVPAFDLDIRGRYTDAISEAHTVTLPRLYTAMVKKTAKLQYSTGKEEIQYFLEKLEPIDAV